MIKFTVPNCESKITDLTSYYDACIGAKENKIRFALIKIVLEVAAKFRNSSYLDITSKGTRDLVTQVDVNIESAIKKQVESLFPDHEIIGEETGKKGKSLYKWIIDPIDGTLNFAAGIPFFAISIGIMKDKEILFGAIYDPIHDELFFSQKECGAWVNNQKVVVSKSPTLITSSLGLDLSYNLDLALENVSLMHRLLPHIRTQRILGSASLGMAYVGCGRLDGYYHNRVEQWDVAAGCLFVNEAGGRITNFSGDNLALFSDKTIVASNTYIHDELIAIINS